MEDRRSHSAIEVSEAFAEGAASRDELANAHQEARLASAAANDVVMTFPVSLRQAPWKVYKAAQAAAIASAPWNTTEAYQSAAEATFGDLQQIEAEYRAQADLVRDIFGNPFRTVAIDPAWLAWNHGTVPAIARHIYEDRAFHDLPILADALEDAGCTNTDLLDHCRGPGPHVRGCWAVDLLLGKS